MIGLLLLAILSLLHVEPPYLETRADVLELNHVYDSKAAHTFSQLIGWNWDDGQLHVEWWRFTDKEGTSYRLNGSYADLHIYEHWYRVRYGRFEETFTQWDPERIDIHYWPQECRRELPERMPQGGP